MISSCICIPLTYMLICMDGEEMREKFQKEEKTRTISISTTTAIYYEIFNLILNILLQI